VTFSQVSTIVTLDGPPTVTEGWARAGAAIRARATRRRAGLSVLIVCSFQKPRRGARFLVNVAIQPRGA
jgi:hypothetical protein